MPNDSSSRVHNAVCLLDQPPESSGINALSLDTSGWDPCYTNADITMLRHGMLLLIAESLLWFRSP
ncbi:hypothetical protein J6590_092374 [Homalodisca vitripennis]|nr:hypothetical protein J6590_092374 [Homalodisca vitripennis]